MVKILNSITRFLFGVDCYPEISNSILDHKPNFKTYIPSNYDYDFNSWSKYIHWYSYK